MSVHYICAWCPWSPEESIGSPGTLMVMSRHVSVGNQTSVLCKSKCSQQLSHLYSPKTCEIKILIGRVPPKDAEDSALVSQVLLHCLWPLSRPLSSWGLFFLNLLHILPSIHVCLYAHISFSTRILVMLDYNLSVPAGLFLPCEEPDSQSVRILSCGA